MLDADIAELFGVETRALNQAVKRNIDRFPADFMFKLTGKEKAEVITNCDHEITINCGANKNAEKHRYNDSRRENTQKHPIYQEA